MPFNKYHTGSLEPPLGFYDGGHPSDSNQLNLIVGVGRCRPRVWLFLDLLLLLSLSTQLFHDLAEHSEQGDHYVRALWGTVSFSHLLE